MLWSIGERSHMARISHEYIANGIHLHDLNLFILPLRKDTIIFGTLMILDQNLEVLISM